MKPDWDELGLEFDSSKKVLIGDVDCTVETNKALCEREGVKGYPTLKYYTPGEDEGQDYEGGRSLEELMAFAKKLGPGCTPATLKRCTDEQRAEIEGYLAMGAGDLEAKLAEAADAIAAQEAEHQALLKSLQAQFEASDKALKELKAEHAPSIKLMKAALKKAKADEPKADAPTEEEAKKDEV
jgi:hypothetical protein